MKVKYKLSEGASGLFKDGILATLNIFWFDEFEEQRETPIPTTCKPADQFFFVIIYN